MSKNKLFIYLISAFIFVFLVSNMGKLTQKKDPNSANSVSESVSENVEKPVTASLFPLPKFTANTISDTTFDSHGFDNKVLIIDFWATWCPPCVREIPHFIELQKKYKDKIQIIGLAVSDEFEKVSKFSADKGINYPIVMADGVLTSQFGDISGIPTTFIVNQDKKVIQRIVGYQSFEFFDAIISKLVH